MKTSSREVAQDITQDVFVKTWQKIKEGVSIENPKAYLFKVARNLIIDYYRKSKSGSLDTMIESGFDINDSSHEDMFFDEEVRQALIEINKLDKIYQEPLYLRITEGLGPREIAEILGESTNTISVRINRGLAKIREVLRYE